MSGGGQVYLSALGILNALGHGKAEVAENLFAGRRPGLVQRNDLLVDGSSVFVGQVDGPLPDVPDRLAVYASRNLQLAIAAAEEIRADLEEAISRYGRERVAVVLGTSTSGIAEGERALEKARADGCLPDGFDMRMQEIGSAAESLARYLELGGPAITVSTACSSGAQALAKARRMIRTGLADAVVAGGVDSLCRLTINGFQALSAQSSQICNPFSRNRDGTTIGEGAAIFLLDRREAEIELLGVGTSTDAYSMTAPDPDGKGVEAAIGRALNDAQIEAGEIDYVQLHGTGTPQNDATESAVILRLFGASVPCSSSKGQIGHTLGAAGAMGIAHCWLSARSGNKARYLPPHLWDGAAEEGLLSNSLVSVGQTLDEAARCVFMTNAIAFGGNNLITVIGRRLG